MKIQFGRRATSAALAALLALGTPSLTVAQTAPPTLAIPRGLEAETLVALEHPWGMAFMPDGSLLITEKPGRLRVYRQGVLSPPIAGVPSVAFRGQGGLLDVEIDPAFSRNRFVYLTYAEAGEATPGARDVPDGRLGEFQELDDGLPKGLAVARARLDGDRLSEVRVIWRAEKTVGRGHFGGRLAFDRTGNLLITSGDRQRFEPAQDRASDLGKVIRVDTEGRAPADNPFARGPEAERDVYSYGHRNPLGLVMDRRSGAVWLNEMGPLGGDEINLLRAGGDFGWPTVSEGDHYDRAAIPRSATRPDFVAPVRAWNPAVSPSGLALYEGALFPAWRGSLLIGGLSSQALVRMRPSASGEPETEVIPLGVRVRDVAEAADGAILILTDGPSGALVRLTPATR